MYPYYANTDEQQQHVRCQTAQHTAQGRRQSALLVPVHADKDRYYTMEEDHQYAKMENEDATLSTKALKLGLQVVAQDMDELDLIVCSPPGLGRGH